MYSFAREKNRCTWSVMPETFWSSWEGERMGRSVERPEGSPMEPVAPPI